jgi:DNA-directed RNA polymerase specialized sigma24 family protein
MANTEARALGSARIEELFRARYLEMVRLAGLLGADDPEDIAQEAFARLMNRDLRRTIRRRCLPNCGRSSAT